ncbi:hypothetical protein [Herbaspirillum rubrisubalbicans]|uniref:hypothetical protein n=1 Tax=Herbaspirillum rubrisubalbicans TaxID=80842 RepID=UPI0015C531E1|nr:hypothetical protein [Herbaspirillum rubrisubalbicans]NQE47972.1 hypothetical protein [Herbaspirillum rubrisubalbicans]
MIKILLTTDYLLLINLLASLALFLHCVFALNRMNHRSNHLVRAWYVIAGFGSFGVLAGPLYGYIHPQPMEVIANVGAAGLLAGGWLYRNRRATDTGEKK